MGEGNIATSSYELLDDDGDEVIEADKDWENTKGASTPSNQVLNV